MVSVTEATTVELWHNFNPVSEDLRANYLKSEMIRKIRAIEMVSIYLEIDFSWFVGRIVGTQVTRDVRVKAGGLGEPPGPRRSALLTERLHRRVITLEAAALDVVVQEL